MFALHHTCSGHKAALYTLAPGRSKRHFLSAGGDGWVVEWNLDDPETGHLLASVETQVFSLLSIPERHLVLAGNMNGGLHWIRYDQPEQTRNILHHQKGIYDIHAIDSRVFTAGGDGLLSVWDVETGRSVESYHLSNQALRCIAYSPVREELAIGASDGSVYLLNSTTLGLKHILTNAHEHSVFSTAYTPDGKFLLSGGRDAMLRIWKTDDFLPVSEQPAHWYTLNHIAFSPDGALFATASRDKTVKIWDTRSFSLLKVLDTIRDGGHINSVNRLLWQSDCLVSASDDRTVKIWEG
ncbi:MAG: WD40 repeat domain-containing protein [Saprospiraceae bacterium]|nr:WD40 repeat domain-containing protein [Saprospiraceae bacterium]